ncbi:MAG: S-layer homology domain-containing protein [Deltaproteobacteria bacterium]|nr:S-layer homology domain-containing protein [Deltaproteobacteria bacterium]
MIRFPVVLVALLLLISAGCAKHVSKCTSPEDNPQHHYLLGMGLLEKGDVTGAEDKFQRAITCEEGFGPAYAGVSLVNTEKAIARYKAQKDAAHMKVDVDRAMESLEASAKNAKDDEDTFAYHVAVIRVDTALKPGKWLDDAEEHYKAAMKLKVDDRKLLYYDGREAAMYFMGRAYLEGKAFQAARDRFADVIGEKTSSKWAPLAEKQWNRTDKIVRAMAGITVGDVGKTIAAQGMVSRADMAALLIDELKIDKLFAGRIPVESRLAKMKADFTPADTLASPFKDEILTLMKWGVRGLEPVYDEQTRAYMFRPDNMVTRKEFALVLEDVLIKLMGDDKLATAYFGQDKSPFPDVAASAAWYNAVMNVVTRSIMETELSGEFRPDAMVDGAEAILAIRVLRHRLNIN